MFGLDKLPNTITCSATAYASHSRKVDIIASSPVCVQLFVFAHHECTGNCIIMAEHVAVGVIRQVALINLLASVEQFRFCYCSSLHWIIVNQ